MHAHASVALFVVSLNKSKRKDFCEMYPDQMTRRMLTPINAAKPVNTMCIQVEGGKLRGEREMEHRDKRLV